MNKLSSTPGNDVVLYMSMALFLSVPSCSNINTRRLKEGVGPTTSSRSPRAIKSACCTSLSSNAAAAIDGKTLAHSVAERCPFSADLITSDNPDSSNSKHGSQYADVPFG